MLSLLSNLGFALCLISSSDLVYKPSTWLTLGFNGDQSVFWYPLVYVYSGKCIRGTFLSNCGVVLYLMTVEFDHSLIIEIWAGGL